MVKVVTLLVTPIDAEKLTLASREGMLRLAMRNYSDAKIVATRGIGLPDLLHRRRRSRLNLARDADTAGAGGVTARPAHGLHGFPNRSDARRQVVGSDFLCPFRNRRARIRRIQAHQETAGSLGTADALPAPAAPDNPPESPVSSAKPAWSASFTEPPESAFAAVRSDAINGHAVD